MKKKLFSLIREQIRQGAAPKKMALTIALGLTLGVFPILGSTTLLCLIFAQALKLNQPAIHFVNYLLYPAQILLIPFFIRAGEWMFRAEPLPFSVSKALQIFSSDPALFLHKFGVSGLYAIAAWTTLALPVMAGTYFAILPVLQGLQGDAQ